MMINRNLELWKRDEGGGWGKWSYHNVPSRSNITPLNVGALCVLGSEVSSGAKRRREDIASCLSMAINTVGSM